jgi:hypothetical protein
MTVRRKYKVMLGTSSEDEYDAAIEVQDLRGITGGIEFRFMDYNAPSNYDIDDLTSTLALDEAQTRSLIAVLRRALGEISETQLAELVPSDTD